jgi:hypothetical protein
MRRVKVQEQTSCVLPGSVAIYSTAQTKQNETFRFPVSRGEVQTRAVGGLGRVVVEMVNTRQRDGMG